MSSPRVEKEEARGKEKENLRVFRETGEVCTKILETKDLRLQFHIY